MKALIIILALVGVSFIGLLIYGETRSQQPKEACARIPKDPTDADQWKDWCPPGIASATKGLQVRFGPGLGLKKATMLRSQGTDASFVVGRSDKDTRTAKLKLIGGDAAILSDGGDGQLCLCRPGSVIDGSLFSDQCPSNWKHAHSSRQCLKRDDAGVMPFDGSGGRIVLKAQPPAAISIE